MKISVDLTKEKFDGMDSVSFYDSKTIFFDPTSVLPTTVSFKVWGAGLLPKFDWEKYTSFDKIPHIKKIREQTTGETTIKGFGLLTLNDVVAGKIRISPYDKGTFLKYSDGRQVEYKREWTLEKIDNESYEYWLDTSIYFPYGACDLKLYAKGAVNFDFDTNDCVNYSDYITDKNRHQTFWGYLQDRILTTNSYKYEDLDH